MPSVLIIDDHVGTRETFSLTLQQAGFSAVSATSGGEGIALAKTQPFSVLLIDLRLPDMSGLDVIRALKESGTAGRMVIVTAYPALDTSFEAGRVGADGYISGPLFDNEIVDVVRRAVSERLAVNQPTTHFPTTDESGRLRGVNASARVRQAKQIIQDELSTRFRVVDLAGRLKCSPSTLSHQFRTSTGMSICEYRTARRLSNCVNLLTMTRLAIRQIAYSVGYQSMSLADFRRDFRQRFGMSPQAYRSRFWRAEVVPWLENDVAALIRYLQQTRLETRTLSRYALRRNILRGVESQTAAPTCRPPSIGGGQS